MHKNDRKIKAALFSGDITRTGGTERAACFLANGLAEDPRFDVSVVSLTESGSTPGFLLNPAIPRHTLSDRWILPGPGYLPVIRRLAHLVKREGISVLIDVDTVLDVLSFPCRRLTGIRVVSWAHFQYYELLGTPYRAWLRRFTCRFADHIVALTAGDARAWKTDGKASCPVTAIPNSVDDLPPYSPPAQREKLILSAGRLVPIKGFEDVIRIAEQIVPRFPDWKFLIAGDGEEYDRLTEQIRGAHLEGSVILLPFQTDMAQLYLKSSVFLLTSRSEGFSLVLLEAKYYRLPSVSYDIMSGPSDIILDGVNGYLVPPERPDLMAEKLAELLGDEKLRRSFSEHAWDNLPRFSGSAALKQWTELLLSLCP